MKNKNLVRITGLIFFLNLLLLRLPAASEVPHFPASERGAGKLFVGEMLVYSIRYFGIPIGKAEAEVLEKVPMGTSQAYHVRVKVWSNPIVDLIYKVRGEHHTFMESTHFYSLRYENRSEQSADLHFVMDFDPQAQRVQYGYPEKDPKKQFPIRPRSQDQLSMGYFFRTLPLKRKSLVEIPVHAEEQNWTVQARTYEIKRLTLNSIGTFEAIRVEPSLPFVTTLASKKGSIVAWVGMDERRIPLRLKVKAPLVGKLKIELIQYRPGQAEKA